MLLDIVENILLCAFAGFVWACIAGLAMVAMERGGLLHEVRNLMILKVKYVDEDTLQNISENNKFAKFLTCQICFTSHIAIYISIALYFAFGFGLAQCLGFIAFSYFFSQKV